jgi:hypothetical protein
MELQARMNAAFDNYLALSDLLMSDGLLLLEMDQTDARWQRIFIRTAAALVEGYSHCFREMAAVGLECDSSAIPNKEREVLATEISMGTSDRIKLTLRATYRMFNLTPMPDFGSENWSNAKLALEKRHVLMHPKTVADLEIPPGLWERIHSGLSWLIEQHFNVITAIHERYVEKRS